MPLIEDLASRTFAARDAVHRQHWRTGSYAAHMALGELYEALVESIDEIVEVYQGRFGLIGAFSVSSEPQASIVAYLEGEVSWVESNRDEIAGGSTAVSNLLDGLIGEYRRALYKLRNLS